VPSALRWLIACGLAVCAAEASAKPCPRPFVLCDGICTDVLVDGRNCGSCGALCPPGHTCQAGACALTCAAPSVRCGQGCADLASDPASCGACGNACAAGQACLAGACADTCTGAGGTPCGGTCVSLSSDTAHCGACGHACPAGTSCQAGSCLLACAAPLEACGSACADTRGDPAHCGACGTACGAGDACLAGACVPATCAARNGGAFVTFESCGQSVKLWAVSPGFIAQAEQLMALPQPIFAVMDLRPGGDCDREWSWHGDPATLGFAPFTVEACQGCPRHVETDLAYWLGFGSFCAPVDRVSAVERR